jgi:drug/metabolite transporter (DMT)-like permease
VFVTGLGYTFYFLAMEVSSAATASIVFFIKPALAPILALIILHEQITLTKGIGILMILIGSLISLLSGLKVNRVKPPQITPAEK